jgi:hypothetical protein
LRHDAGAEQFYKNLADTTAPVPERASAVPEAGAALKSYVTAGREQGATT